MLARLQRSIVFLLLAASLAWAGFFMARGQSGWAFGGLVVIVAAYAFTIGFEFLLLAGSYSARDDNRPSAADLFVAWWAEILVAPRVFLWSQPFRSKAHADVLSPANPASRGVVLVHGFFCNRGLWNPWMERLAEARVPFVALTLEPVFGSIDDYAPRIDEAVTRLQAATGHAPMLVAHSMGGLAARAWLQRFRGSGRIHRVVTIGTPHRGTAMARRAYTTNTRQMRIGSAWLEALARLESPEAYRLFTCFWSRCDNMVFPTDSATLPGADNRHLRSTPHVRMAFHPQAFAEVMRLVGQE